MTDVTTDREPYNGDRLYPEAVPEVQELLRSIQS